MLNKSRDNLMKYAIIFLLVIMLLRVFFLHPTFSDENFYFNVAKQILQGKRPYQDFFFSHPPLQAYSLAMLLKLFGIEIFVAKFLTLFSSSLVAFLVYLVSRKITNENASFASMFFFVLSPIFLAYSLVGIGIFEALLMFMLALLFYLSGRSKLASLFMALSISFKLIALFFVPIFLLFGNRKTRKQFIFYFIIFGLIAFSSFFMIFGGGFVNQVVLFQLTTKPGIGTPLSSAFWSFEILNLSLVVLAMVFLRKEKVFVYLSLVPFVLDMTLASFLTSPFYHYFTFALPFYSIVAGRIFVKMKDNLLKIGLVMLFAVSILFNFQTILYYSDPTNSERIDSIARFISLKAANSTIFGEPSMTNYVSFEYDSQISGDYLDSFLQRVRFEGVEKTVSRLLSEKPAIFIEMERTDGRYYSQERGLADFIKENYRLAEVFEGTPKYLIFELKQ